MRGTKTFTWTLIAATAISLSGCAARQETPIAQAPPVLVPVIPHGTLPSPDPNATTLMDQTLSAVQIRRERILVLYEDSRRRAVEALTKNQYPQAQAEALNALELANGNPTLFSSTETTALRNAAQSLLDQIDSRWRQALANQLSVSATDAQRAEEHRTITLQQSRREKVAALVADARQLEAAAQFREAADLLQQAVTLDPQNQDAQLALRLINDKITDRQYEAIRHRTGQEVMRQNLDNAEHLVPYSDLMTYPNNWPETTRKRLPMTNDK